MVQTKFWLRLRWAIGCIIIRLSALSEDTVIDLLMQTFVVWLAARLGCLVRVIGILPQMG
jgi:hypothetical protein